MSKSSYIPILVFLFFNYIAKCQSIDYNKLVDDFIEKSFAIYTTNNDSAIFYLQEALKISKESKNDTLIAESNLLLGNAYYTFSSYRKAVKYYYQSYLAYKRLKDTLNMAYAINTTGMASKYWGKYENALKYSLEADSLFQLINNKPGLTSSKMVIAYIYMMLGEIMINHLNIVRNLCNLRNQLMIHPEWLIAIWQLVTIFSFIIKSILLIHIIIKH